MGASARAHDTSAEADALQREIYQRLGGEGRIATAFRLTEGARHMTMAGIRARHPDYAAADVQRAYARLVLGDALTRTVWPDRDLVDP
jgi:hypothetical protein